MLFFECPSCAGIESRSDFQVALVRGRRPNLVDRLIAKIALFGLVFLTRAVRKPGGLWGEGHTVAPCPA
jgi:hypothetical protein